MYSTSKRGLLTDRPDEEKRSFGIFGRNESLHVNTGSVVLSTWKAGAYACLKKPSEAAVGDTKVFF